MYFAQLARIVPATPRDHFHAEIRECVASSAGRSTQLLPVHDLLDNFIPNPIDLAQIAAARAEDLLRCFENLEQLAQPHRAHRREHVQRDARFRGVHIHARPEIGLHESFR